MHVHISLHRGHSHRSLVGRISRDLGSAVDWLTGPAMSDRDRMQRDLAEARNRELTDAGISG